MLGSCPYVISIEGRFGERSQWHCDNQNIIELRDFVDHGRQISRQVENSYIIIV